MQIFCFPSNFCPLVLASTGEFLPCSHYCEVLMVILYFLLHLLIGIFVVRKSYALLPIYLIVLWFFNVRIDSCMFNFILGLQLNIVIYFIAQIVSALAFGNSLRLVSMFFHPFWALMFWPHKMLQGHLVFFLPSPGIDDFEEPWLVFLENGL